MIPDHPFDDYRNRRVLVMGLGSFGGGIGAVRYLVRQGAIVTVTDLRPAEKLAESLEELGDTPPDRVVFGGHHEDDFRTAELVVVNPAVKRNCPFLNAAIRAGVPVTSEMNLFWKWNPAPVVAITGSNGKSTTTAMTHAIISQWLQPQGRKAWLGGNIGASLLPIVDQIQPRDVVVLELSSFQLADLNRIEASPHVAIVTNFAPNHLDWHVDLDDYRQAKQSVLRWQTANDIAVLNDDDPDVSRWEVCGRRLGFGLKHQSEFGAFAEGKSAVIRNQYGERKIPLDQWLTLPGRHNFANALGAIAAADSMGVDDQAIQSAIENYQPLPHRLQLVGECGGRRFYNDSLATTPESTLVALDALDSPIILLAGGYDKHVDLSEMSHAIARKTKAAAVMGQTGPLIREQILSVSDRTCLVSEPQTTFAGSFNWAWDHSSPGDAVLLSPGCASYDWFRNFADRGSQFASLVNSKRATVSRE